MTTLQDILDPQIDRSFKGFPHTSPALRRSQIAAQHWRVLDGDLPLPVALVRQQALQHNGPKRRDAQPFEPAPRFGNPQPDREADRKEAYRARDEPMAMFVEDAADPFGWRKREHVPAVTVWPVRHRKSRSRSRDEASRKHEENRARGNKFGEPVEHCSEQAGRPGGRPPLRLALVASSWVRRRRLCR